MNHKFPFCVVVRSFAIMIMISRNDVASKPIQIKGYLMIDR